MQKTKLLLIIAIAIFGMAFFNAAQAEEATVPSEFQGPSIAAPVNVAGTVNCFDYYKFGSVQVDVESDITATVSGVPLTFQATIKNDNAYPIVEGAVYAKVFKIQSDQDKSHANGNYLVDQFFVADNISLDAKENKNINFTWQIPGYATTGEYQIAMFFTSAKKFNLLGLSFTDDVVGNTMNFQVNGELTTGVYFNKNTVDINGTNYHFAAFPPQFKEEDIVAKAELINSTTESQAIPITYKLYSWDGQTEDNLIDTKTETVQLNPNETKQIAYAIQDKTSPVYYLVVEANYQDTKSILDIRTVRSDVNKVRINFPSITSYPLKQNEPNTLFVCAHNSGTADVVENNKLVMTILDENQNQIHQYKYEGQISGAMMGLKEDFTPQETYATFSIKTELYTDNKLVDSATMKYDCQEINKDLCPAKTAMGDVQNNPYVKAGIIIILVLTLGLSLIVFVIKRKRPYINLLILGFVLSTMLLGGVGRVEAKSVVWTTTENNTFTYYLRDKGGESVTTPSCHSGCTDKTVCEYPYPFKTYEKDSSGAFCSAYVGWRRGLVNPNISITYNAQIVNVGTGAAIADGANIPVGTQIRLEKIAPQNTDISWVGTGYSYDSPYGSFLANATAPTQSCDDTFYVSKTSDGYKVYIPLSVNPPTISFSHSGTAGLSCDSTGSACTVNSAGTIKANIVFSDTYGKFYYRYSYNGNCRYTNVSMEEIDGTASYKLPVPAQTISFNLTVAGANNTAPNVPTLTGPTTGSTNASYNFTATTTDPENDTLRYGFDWNNDSIVDQWMPASGYVSSGTAQTASKSWTTTGAKVLKAQACDSKGACSGWSLPATITISAPVVFSCTGGNPPSGATWCASDDTGLKASIDWAQGIGNVCTTTRKCEYTMPTYSCTGGNPPSGSSWCTDDAIGLTADLPWAKATNNTCTTTRKCEYTTPTYSCTGGNPPYGASWCVDDAIGLTANLPWVKAVNNTCTTARKCEYIIPTSPTGTWTDPICPTACGSLASNPGYTCVGGNGLCATNFPATKSCAATAACVVLGTCGDANFSQGSYGQSSSGWTDGRVGNACSDNTSITPSVSFPLAGTNSANWNCGGTTCHASRAMCVSNGCESTTCKTTTCNNTCNANAAGIKDCPNQDLNWKEISPN